MSMRWVRRFDVRSFTDGHSVYTVAIAASGMWGCSCPRWRFSKVDRAIGFRADCKHIESVKGGMRETLPSRFAGLDLNEAAVRVASALELGARFRHLDFDITVKP